MADTTAPSVWRLAFVDVAQLVKPATSLFAPGLMLRVFRHTGGPKAWGV